MERAIVVTPSPFPADSSLELLYIPPPGKGNALAKPLSAPRLLLAVPDVPLPPSSLAHFFSPAIFDRFAQRSVAVLVVSWANERERPVSGTTGARRVDLVGDLVHLLSESLSPRQTLIGLGMGKGADALLAAAGRPVGVAAGSGPSLTPSLALTSLFLISPTGFAPATTATSLSSTFTSWLNSWTPGAEAYVADVEGGAGAAVGTGLSETVRASMLTSLLGPAAAQSPPPAALAESVSMLDAHLATLRQEETVHLVAHAWAGPLPLPSGLTTVDAPPALPLSLSPRLKVTVVYGTASAYADQTGELVAALAASLDSAQSLSIVRHVGVPHGLPYLDRSLTQAPFLLFLDGQGLYEPHPISAEMRPRSRTQGGEESEAESSGERTASDEDDA